MKKVLVFLIPIFGAICFWVFFDSYETTHFPKEVTYPCVSYVPNEIESKEAYSKERLFSDLQKVKKFSNCVRVYSSTNGLEEVPGIAETLDMEVIIGAWIDKDFEKNEKEINNLIKVANSHNNIKYVVVGSETLLMHRVTPEYLYKKLDLVRSKVVQPVTTTEFPSDWRYYEELSSHVDLIGIHNFPYWEGTRVQDAVENLKGNLSSMEEDFKKPVIVLEIGWPTAGPNYGKAEPGLINQKRYLKEATDFLSTTEPFYNVIEAFDVPSKITTTEGLVGMHWGILTYDGKERHIFPVGFLFLFIFFYTFLFSIAYFYNRAIFILYEKHSKKKFLLRTVFLFIVFLATLVAWMLIEFYQLFIPIAILLQICFTLIAIYSYFECVNKGIHFLFSDFAKKYILNQEKDESDLNTLMKRNGKVSIFLAAKDESPKDVIATLESLLVQTYSNIEVLYIDNNSKNRDSFEAVSLHFKDRKNIKLFFEEKIEGFKAGALNYLLKKVDTDSNFIAVVDADYIVEKVWIETALRYVKSDTGFVQFPQAYRLEESDVRLKNLLKVGATVEQKFVFDVVYPVRSLIGDVVQNGTMVLINKKFLEEGWPTYSICEDAALGLNMSKKGGRSVYIPLVMGKGLPPQTFKAIKKQRNRWVFGAIQIMQKLCLKPFQKHHKTAFLFLTDWLLWFMQGFYPILLISSFGFVAFIWLVFLHLQISWVMLVGFSFVFLSLFLFVSTYFKVYKKERGIKKTCIEIFSLIILECSLVNTISKTVLSGLLFRKSEFLITRQSFKIGVKDLVTLILATTTTCIGILLFYILFYVNVPFSLKMLGAAQLFVVMAPQFAYMYLLVRY